jgi:hypothetical protein
MCSAVWGRKHEIGDGLMVLAQILIGEEATVIDARLLGAGSAYSLIRYCLWIVSRLGQGWAASLSNQHADDPACAGELDLGATK